MPRLRLGGGTPRTLTITALLGLFVVAVVVALATRLLPGGRSKLMGRLLNRRNGGAAPES